MQNDFMLNVIMQRIVLLNAVMLSVIYADCHLCRVSHMLSVLLLNVVMLNVVAPELITAVHIFIV
jgi:hypothetical protein